MFIVEKFEFLNRLKKSADVQKETSKERFLNRLVKNIVAIAGASR